MVAPPPIRYADAATALERAFSHLSAAPQGGAQVPALRRWIELLCEWNARIDLTAARSGGELVDLMLADALALRSRIPQGARVVDVGTGAGAPGLALALMRPDLAVTMCEPLAKRTSFLRTVLGTVNRSDVQIAPKRGEDLQRGAWDVAISRATLAPEKWLALGSTLVAPGGSVWVLLAAGEPPAPSPAEDVTYDWPETRASRRAVRYVVNER